ncbi:MAG: T9SS type A sorting domain-containing protein [Bacteroidetes bacterium]|nr:MAG: T9SS type A sorting domain-containing protein [Bacteroidota bacterium]
MRTLNLIAIFFIVHYATPSFSQKKITIIHTTIPNTSDLSSSDVNFGDTIVFINYMNADFASFDFYIDSVLQTTKYGIPLFGDIVSYVVSSGHVSLRTSVVDYPGFYRQVNIGEIGFLGLDEEEADYKLFPNPVSDNLIVKGTIVESMIVFDLEGKVVAEGESNELDVSNLSGGMYFVQLNHRLKERFIKE